MDVQVFVLDALVVQTLVRTSALAVLDVQVVQDLVLMDVQELAKILARADVKEQVRDCVQQDAKINVLADVWVVLADAEVIV